MSRIPNPSHRCIVCRKKLRPNRPFVERDMTPKERDVWRTINEHYESRVLEVRREYHAFEISAEKAEMMKRAAAKCRARRLRNEFPNLKFVTGKVWEFGPPDSWGYDDYFCTKSHAAEYGVRAARNAEGQRRPVGTE